MPLFRLVSCRSWAFALTALVACGGDRGDGRGDDGDDDGAMEEPPAETPELVTRYDPEPAGANCAAGGTAVHAGLDSNRNGVLDDGEIEWTEYLCTAPAAQVVREDELAPSDTCPEGGKAIHLGLDDDRDGILDDDEIDETTIVCGESQIWRGDVAEVDWSDPVRRAALHVARVVTGTVVVPVDGAVELPVLEMVQGDLAIHGDLTALVVPALRTVGGSLRIEAPNLSSLVLPALEQVGAEVFVTNTGTDDGGVEAPVLTAIGGRLMLWVDSRGAVSMPSLRDVGGDLHVGGAVASLALDTLRTIGGNLDVHSGELERVRLPALESLGGTTDAASNDVLVSIELPALREIGGELDFHAMRALVSLSVPDLREIRGSVFLASLPALQTVDAGSLFDVDGGITIRDAPRLTSLGLGALARVGVTNFLDSFQLTDSGLEVLDLTRLSGVAGHITIATNPALRAVRLPVLQFATSLRVHDAEVLNELTAPLLRSLDTFSVGNNPQLTLLDLGNLESSSIILLSNASIPDLSGLRGLVFVDTIALIDLDQLQDLRGLARLQRLDNLNVRENQALRTFEGVQRLTQLPGFLHIGSNPSLVSLAGLENIEHVGNQLTIDDNAVLVDLALTRLLSVGRGLNITDNRSLTTLDGLAALTSVHDSPQFWGNELLPDEEIQALLARLGF